VRARTGGDLRNRGSAASMTSTTIGLPDRYRPLDEVGPEEQTETGLIRCWRAKDRVLNRDVAVRVHTPAGSAAHAWIARALTAGGLANPALAMVYDASEGSDDPGTPGSAAYVVNEWIEGETLADRLTRGPLPERELRPMLRRLADAVAEAHRVGLALGGLTAANVVLRPNGLVGVRAVPAATGTMDGDINALGALLETCLTGTRPEDADAPLSGPPDLVALVHRARSTEPGQGLSSVAAMAALLAERPRQATGATGRGEGGEGRRRRTRDRRPEPLPEGRRGTDQPTRVAGPVGPTDAADAPDRSSSDEAPRPLDPQDLPPVPVTRSVDPVERPDVAAAQPSTAPDAGPSGRRGDTVSVGMPPAAVPPLGADSTPDPDDPYALGVLDDDLGEDEDRRPRGETTEPSARRRLVVVGLPVLALLLVVGLAWWLGSSVLSVAGNYDDIEGSTPSAGAPAGSSGSGSEAPASGGPVRISGASVFDPGGDGAPENDDEVPLTYDGDPATAWSTLTYQGSSAFGNLKDGVGVVYDLGSEQTLAGATLTTTLPGATVEIRAADGPDGDLESWPVLAEGTLEATTEFTFEEPAATQYVLVWYTDLVPAGEGFKGDLAEIALAGAA
jgi:eukaryotic-like serine/threonine-protein kinase